MSDYPHSIAGDWQGTSISGGPDAQASPVRFAVTWTTTGGQGRFTGTLRDDTGRGEATTDGMQSGHQIAFTKVYATNAESYLHPTAYEGALSDDGLTVQGTWRMGNMAGTWEASREAGAA